MERGVMEPMSKEDFYVLEKLTRLDKQTRVLLAPVLSAEPGKLSERQQRLRDCLRVWDADPFVKRQLGIALSNQQPIPADPAHAEVWAAARVVDRLTPEQRAAFLAAEEAAAAG
jgi:hypothetical protein